MFFAFVSGMLKHQGGVRLCESVIGIEETYPMKAPLVENTTQILPGIVLFCENRKDQIWLRN